MKWEVLMVYLTNLFSYNVYIRMACLPVTTNENEQMEGSMDKIKNTLFSVFRYGIAKSQD